jgi:predicted ATPase
VVQVVVVHLLHHLLQSQLVLVDLVQQIRDLVEGMGQKLQHPDLDILLAVAVVRAVLVVTL